jgi:uncharacterized membrane protein
MKKSNRTDAWVIFALLALGLIPMIAGAVRLWQFSNVSAMDADIARFIAQPLPIYLHIMASLAYTLLGAFQFSSVLRRRYLAWHRYAGRIVVMCGLTVAISGLWMTLFYPVGTQAPASFDGPFLFVIRLFVSIAMIVFIRLGVAAIMQRNISQHRAWMMRAYALGLGAGTQVFTHIPWFLFPSIHGEWARAACMTAGWAINLAVVESLLTKSAQGKDVDTQ